MVPMRGKQAVEALHELSSRSADAHIRAVDTMADALADVGIRAPAPSAWFMVPMRAKNGVGALHEPELGNAAFRPQPRRNFHALGQMPSSLDQQWRLRPEGRAPRFISATQDLRFHGGYSRSGQLFQELDA